MLGLLVLGAVALLPLAAQAPPAQQEETPVFRTETSLALVHFHVVRKNLYVDDLKREDVVLLEDGQSRQITFFEGGRATRRTIPIEVVLLFDTSGSVVNEGLLDPLLYKTTFLDPFENVKISIYGFDRHLRRFTRATRDYEQLVAGLKRVVDFKAKALPKPEMLPIELFPKRKADPRGGSWIYEGIAATARAAAANQDKTTRMMLVFSDGFSTTDARPEDAAAVARELGVPVYPVALGHGKLIEQAKHIQQTGVSRNGVLNDGAQRRLDNIQSKEREIQEYASVGELTGGRSFDPPILNLTMMRTIMGAMVGQVRTEFIVGFTPENSTGQPKKHKLEVKLASKELGKVAGGTRMVVH